MSDKNCINHPGKKAYSICFSCKKNFCLGCLIEGYQHYYCSNPNCKIKLELELDFKQNTRFCQKCSEETDDVGLGDISSVNLTGQMFSGKEDICTACTSFVTTVKSSVIGIKIGKGEKFRIIVLELTESLSGVQQTFLSRKLKT